MKNWKYYIPLYGLWIVQDEPDENIQSEIIFYHFFVWVPILGIITGVILFLIDHVK